MTDFKKPWRFERDGKWPFNPRIVNADDEIVVSEDTYAWSSVQKTLDDVMAGVGIDAADRDACVAANAAQEARLKMIVEAVNAHGEA